MIFNMGEKNDKNKKGNKNKTKKTLFFYLNVAENMFIGSERKFDC